MMRKQRSKKVIIVELESWHF